jgi:hypothetical protein
VVADALHHVRTTTAPMQVVAPTLVVVDALHHLRMRTTTILIQVVAVAPTRVVDALHHLRTTTVLMQVVADAPMLVVASLGGVREYATFK